MNFRRLFAKFQPVKPRELALTTKPPDIEFEDEDDEDSFERRPVDPVQSIHQSEWYPEMNSECRQHIGKKDNQYYFALEISPSHDDEIWLSWRGPFDTAEQAQEECDKAFDRWSGAFNQSWEQWENAQIANVEGRAVR
jgi:hypothetical protein